MKSSSKTTTTVVVVAAVAVLVTAVAWARRSSSSKKKVGGRVERISSPHRSKLVSPQLWKAFEEAAHRIRTLRSLSNGDKLMLYGLYKQIVVGDATAQNRIQGGWNIMVEQAKYSAWCKMRGMPIDIAIAHYLDAVNYFSAADDAAGTDSPSSAASFTGSEHKCDQDDVSSSAGGLGPAAVSLPAVETGGMDYENEAQDDSAQARLLRAAGESDIAALKTILSSSADDSASSSVLVNYADESGQTALHLAADKGCSECVQLLLDAGANVNAADDDGISVLQAAVIAGHVQTSALLLRHGADPDHADDDGDTPRSCAVDDGNKDMKQLFSFDVPSY